MQADVAVSPSYTLAARSKTILPVARDGGIILKNAWIQI